MPLISRLDETLRSLLPPNDQLRTSGPPVPVTEASPHAVVVGAGLGGLAAAIRLGARGYRVTVVDRLDQPGGRARRQSAAAAGLQGPGRHQDGRVPRVVCEPSTGRGSVGTSYDCGDPWRSARN